MNIKQICSKGTSDKNYCYKHSQDKNIKINSQVKNIHKIFMELNQKV